MQLPTRRLFAGCRPIRLPARAGTLRLWQQLLSLALALAGPLACQDASPPAEESSPLLQLPRPPTRIPVLGASPHYWQMAKDALAPNAAVAVSAVNIAGLPSGDGIVAFNGGLAAYNGQTFLTVRVDRHGRGLRQRRCNHERTICMARLDSSQQIAGELQPLNLPGGTDCETAEDARLIACGSAFYAVYNALVAPSRPGDKPPARIFLAELDVAEPNQLQYVWARQLAAPRAAAHSPAGLASSGDSTDAAEPAAASVEAADSAAQAAGFAAPAAGSAAQAANSAAPAAGSAAQAAGSAAPAADSAAEAADSASQAAGSAAEATGFKDEKNWTPFCYDNDLHFITETLPHTVIALPRAELRRAQQGDKQSLGSEQALQLTRLPRPPATETNIAWDGGSWRGGTPALFEPAIGEYVSFFHSHVAHGEHRLYYAGFYSFAAEPPFAISRYVAEPIDLPPVTPRWHPVNRILFPMGLIDDSSRYLVTYGQDDFSLGLAAVDKAALLGELTSLF